MGYYVAGLSAGTPREGSDVEAQPPTQPVNARHRHNSIRVCCLLGLRRELRSRKISVIVISALVGDDDQHEMDFESSALGIESTVICTRYSTLSEADLFRQRSGSCLPFFLTPKLPQAKPEQAF